MRSARRVELAVVAAVLLAAATCAVGAGGVVKEGAPAGPPAGKGLNPQIAGMPDNTWLRLNPAGEPRSRMYSGCCMGDGKLWFFGGGHGGYKYNDVELYDVSANRWDRLTEREAWTEVKAAEGMGGGWGVAVLSAKLRPLGQHTYQQVCWVPERKKFFAVLSPGTWEFDSAAREWECLAGMHAGKLAGKAGPLAPAKYEKVQLGRSAYGYNVTLWKTRDGREVVQARPRDPAAWQTSDGKPVTDVGTFSPGFETGGGLVVYDAVLQKPLCFDGGDAEGRTLWAFDFKKMAWDELMHVPIPRSVRNYAASGLPDGFHLVTSGKDGWWLVNPGKRQVKPLENVPEPLKDRDCQSLTYDTVNKVVLVLGRTEVGAEGKQKVYALDVWTFDPAAEKFTQVPAPAGPRPRSSGPIARWATFWYDPTHNAGIFLGQLGQGGHEGQPCETWAYRLKRAKEAGQAVP